mmetsp:Transcript_19867/g.46546  ORF Transcript_19867/g.46546 Transcript_19867/m.46546 type:complete len:846 (-) Transcript_19867:440-2977(-)
MDRSSSISIAALASEPRLPSRSKRGRRRRRPSLRRFLFPGGQRRQPQLKPPPLLVVIAVVIVFLPFLVPLPLPLEPRDLLLELPVPFADDPTVLTVGPELLLEFGDPVPEPVLLLVEVRDLPLEGLRHRHHRPRQVPVDLLQRPVRLLEVLDPSSEQVVFGLALVGLGADDEAGVALVLLLLSLADGRLALLVTPLFLEDGDPPSQDPLFSLQVGDLRRQGLRQKAAAAAVAAVVVVEAEGRRRDFVLEIRHLPFQGLDGFRQLQVERLEAVLLADAEDAVFLEIHHLRFEGPVPRREIGLLPERGFGFPLEVGHRPLQVLRLVEDLLEERHEVRAVAADRDLGRRLDVVGHPPAHGLGSVVVCRRIRRRIRNPAAVALGRRRHRRREGSDLDGELGRLRSQSLGFRRPILVLGREALVPVPQVGFRRRQGRRLILELPNPDGDPLVLGASRRSQPDGFRGPIRVVGREALVQAPQIELRRRQGRRFLLELPDLDRVPTIAQVDGFLRLPVLRFEALVAVPQVGLRRSEGLDLLLQLPDFDRESLLGRGASTALRQRDFFWNDREAIVPVLQFRFRRPEGLDFVLRLPDFDRVPPSTTGGVGDLSPLPVLGRVALDPVPRVGFRRRRHGVVIIVVVVVVVVPVVDNVSTRVAFFAQPMTDAGLRYRLQLFELQLRDRELVADRPVPDQPLVVVPREIRERRSVELPSEIVAIGPEPIAFFPQEQLLLLLLLVIVGRSGDPATHPDQIGDDGRSGPVGVNGDRQRPTVPRAVVLHHPEPIVGKLRGEGDVDGFGGGGGNFTAATAARRKAGGAFQPKRTVIVVFTIGVVIEVEQQLRGGGGTSVRS